MNKKIISAVLVGALATTALAQSGTNSPYSQFGLGILSDQSQGMNRGMNGLALGLRNGGQVNALNPASYSAVDSLTMVFDVGLSGQVTNFQEGSVKKNAYNADFEYVVGSFRLMPKMGFSFGILPYTNVGYNYSSSTTLNSESGSVAATTYDGSGGVHQVFAGVGWNFFKGLSVGANIAYLWGSYDRTVTTTYSSDISANAYSRAYSADIRSYKLDVGVQWEQVINKKNTVVIGATYGLGHKLNSDATVVVTGGSADTLTVGNAFSIPTSFGIGAAWYHDNSITVGFDYTVQKWGGEEFPEFDKDAAASENRYRLKSGLLSDRHKITLGGEWTPNIMSRNFFKRVRYRVGASYATPYFKVNGNDGPKEYSVSAGFGIPIANSWNNRSVLNISGQYVRSSAADLIKENTFRINIGLTFNERWFMKWKVE